MALRRRKGKSQKRGSGSYRGVALISAKPGCFRLALTLCAIFLIFIPFHSYYSWRECDLLMSFEPEPAVDSLKGKVILAAPKLREPVFFQSVLLLTEHHPEQGSHGYILNRPCGKTVGDLLSTDTLPGEKMETLAEIPVFVGGPVSTEHLTFFAMGWSEYENDLQYASYLSAAEAVRHQVEGFQIRAFVGYSGWSEGQLEVEMEQHAWIIRKPERQIIEVSGAQKLWKDMLRDLSPWHRLIADEPDELGLN